MGVRRGSATPGKVWRGSLAVKKVMRGSVEVWSASKYPASGAWGPMTVPASPAITVSTHTIVEGGSFTITHSAYALDGFVISYLWNPVSGEKLGPAVHSSEGQPSVVTANVTLQAGAIVEFRAKSLINPGTANGTWSIVRTN